MRLPSPTACAAGGILVFLTVCLAPQAAPAPETPAPAPQTAAAQGRGGRGDAQKPPAPPDPRQLIEGTDEDETIKGGTGDDWLFAKKGNDFVVAGAGRDVIDGSEGDDTIDAGADADIVDGAAGGDTIRAGDGDDTIEGGDEEDTIDGGAGIDNLDGGDGDDALRGGAGNDILAGGDENDSLDGGAGNDRLSGEDGADTLFGGPGDDLLFGGEEDDSVDGQAGDDRVDGGDGNDLLRGGPGNDVLLGSSGQDALHAAAGHDFLLGGDGEDLLTGASGSDWILAGPGADTVITGDGDDLIVLRAGDVTVGDLETINGGSGTDALILNGFTRPPVLMGEPGARDRTGELVDPITGGTYRFTGLESTEFTQLLTSAGSVPDRPVSLLLVNPSAAPASGRFVVYGPDGAVLPVSVAGAQARELSPFTVPALGSLRLDGIARGQVTVQVFAGSPLGAIVHGDGRAFHDSPLVDSAAVSVVEDAKAGISTGVVLSNSVTASNVNLSLHRMDGEETDGETFSGAREVALAPYSQTTIFVRDLFPTLGDFRGTLSIDADDSRPQEGGPFTVTTIERSADGGAVTSPAVGLHGPAPGGRVYIQNVTAGGDGSTSIVLMNASRNRPSQGTLRFFDESGKPWMLAVNGQSPAAAVPYDLSPQAAVVLALPAGGPVQRGSVQAESMQGLVGAMMRVTLAAGTARILPGSVSSGLIAAVRRDRATGTTTRVAVASTGADVAVRLTLRAAAGTEVAGATADLRLPANGQIVRTLEQLFPTAAIDTFEGTLTIVAEGGTISGTAAQLDGGAALGTALPVATLP